MRITPPTQKLSRHIHTQIYTDRHYTSKTHLCIKTQSSTYKDFLMPHLKQQCQKVWK